MRERSIWLFVGVVVLALSGLIGLGAAGLMLLVVTPLMVLGMAGVGRVLSRPVDVKWLPNLVVVAFIAKLVGAGIRYYYVRTVYGSGDAFGYYRIGKEFALQWRAGEVPALSGSRGYGTQVMEWVSGLVMVPFMPDFFGAFLLFASLSFFGQLALYAAFRRWAEPHQLKIFALLVLFMPSYVFWPSSIGKEAIMLLGLGIAAYCVARAMEAYEVRWLVGVALAVAGVGFIRIHISALFIGSLLAAAVLAKPRSRVKGIGSRRLMMVVLVALIGLAAANSFQARYGTDLFSSAEVESFSENVADRTTKGSTVPGGPVSSPADIPGALALVLFRPFIWEASDFEIAISALETTFLLGLLVWKLPAIFRNRRKWRANSMVVFSTFYVLFFSIAFSVVRNLGIIARQRTQVLAFFVIIVICLGWEAPVEKKRRPTRQLAPEQHIEAPQLVGASVVGDHL